VVLDCWLEAGATSVLVVVTVLEVIFFESLDREADSFCDATCVGSLAHPANATRLSETTNVGSRFFMAPMLGFVLEFNSFFHARTRRGSGQ
jgi:hypothetical protein